MQARTMGNRSGVISGLRLFACIAFAVVAAALVTMRLPEVNYSLRWDGGLNVGSFAWLLGVFIAMFFALLFYSGPEALVVAGRSFWGIVRQLFYLPELWQRILSLRNLSTYGWLIIASSLFLTITWAVWLVIGYYLFFVIGEIGDISHVGGFWQQCVLVFIDYIWLIVAIFGPLIWFVLGVVSLVIKGCDGTLIEGTMSDKIKTVLLVDLFLNPFVMALVYFGVHLGVVALAIAALGFCAYWLAPRLPYWSICGALRGAGYAIILTFGALYVAVLVLYCVAIFLRTLAIFSHSNRATICMVDAGFTFAAFYPLLMIANWFSLPFILNLILAGVGSGVFGLLNDIYIAPRIQGRVLSHVLIKNCNNPHKQ